MPKCLFAAPCDSELRIKRKQAGLSQQQLGEKVGLSRQAIIAIENGHTQPSLKHAMQLARTLGVTVENLFGKENPRV